MPRITPNMTRRVQLVAGAAVALVVSLTTGLAAQEALPPPRTSTPAPVPQSPYLPPGLATPIPAAPAATPTPPATAEELVHEVRIIGNDTVPETQITSNITTRAGRPYDRAIVQRDVRRLANLGWFVDVKPMSEMTSDGRIVIFQVVERPTTRYVMFLGNKGVSDKKLTKETGLKPGGAVDPFAVEEGRRKIREYYTTHGYNHVQVTILEGNKPTDQGVTYVIHEGTKQKVWKTKFVGNEFVSSSRLKTLVKSKPPILLVFKGYVDNEKIDADVEQLTAYYRSFGFFQARIGRQVEFDDEGKWSTLTFVIHEGPRYSVRDVRFLGNTKFEQQPMSAAAKLQGGQPFEQGKMEADATWLQELYGSHGYVFADVKPETVFLEEPGQVDLVYHIDEGEKWRVGRIFVHIGGDNPHTRIQTALNRCTLRPGQIMDIRELKASERRLMASSLFNTDPAQGERPKITYQIPEDADLGMAKRRRSSGGNFRGQSPDDSGPLAIAPPSVLEELAAAQLAPADSLLPSSAGSAIHAAPARGEGDVHVYCEDIAHYQRWRQAEEAALNAAAPARPDAARSPDGLDIESDAQVMPSGYLDRGAVEQSWQPESAPPPNVWQGSSKSPTSRRSMLPPRRTIRCAGEGRRDLAWQTPSTPNASPVAPLAPYGVGEPYATQYPPSADGAAPQSWGGAYDYLDIRGQDPGVVGYPAAPSPVQPAYATVPAGAPQYVTPAGGYGGQALGATGPDARTSAAAPAAVQQAQYSSNLQPPAGSVYPQPLNPYGPLPGYSVDPTSPMYAGPTGQPSYPEGTVDIFINGSETQTGRLMFGVGVNSNAGVVGNIVVDERNFDWTRYPTSWEDVRNGSAWRGDGQRFRVDASPGSQVSRYLVSWQEPYLFDRPISLGLSGSYFTRRFRDWDEQRTGGRIALGYQWVDRDLTITGAYRGEDVLISRPASPLGQVAALDEALGHNALHGFRLSLINDTRDSPFLATQGHYFEVGGEQVIGSFDYPRVDVDFRKYFLLHERPDHSGRHVLSASTTVGYTGSHTPIYEHFYAGGFDTLRGFDFRGASPVAYYNGNTQFVQVGGEFQWLNSVQYLYPITADDMLHGVVFTDFGTVEPSVKIEDFRVAIGAGLRITVPAMGPAPIALDFAYAAKHADFDDRQVFSFSLGFSR